MKTTLGFTLTEMVVTTTILSIIVAFAIPAFHHLLASWESNQTIRILTMNIQKAKIDAQIYHKNVIICPSEDLENCHNDWNKGFINFIDSNKNRQRDNDETLLFASALTHKYGSLSYRGFGSSPRYVIFQQENGLPFASNGSFIYCSNSLDDHSKLVIGRMGHPRFEKTPTC